MIHFIYTNKLQNISTLIQDVVDKIFGKFRFYNMMSREKRYVKGYRYKKRTIKNEQAVTKKIRCLYLSYFLVFIMYFDVLVASSSSPSTLGKFSLYIVIFCSSDPRY